MSELSDEIASPVSRLRVWLWRAGLIAWLGVMAFALIALEREWAGVRLHDLNTAMAQLGWWHVGLALACTLVSYLSNAAIDLFSLRWLGKKIPLVQALGSALISTAFSLNAGGNLLGGGGVRMRLFTGLGLTAGEVARMTGFVMVAGWAGQILVAGVLLLLSPTAMPWLGPVLVRGLGAGLIVLAGLLVATNAWRRRKDNETSALPPTHLLAGAIVASTVDWLMAGLAIRVLLPTELTEMTTPAFLAVVLISQLLSGLSHVPGGVGVLELSITKLAGAALPSAALAAALLSYRLIYYLLPFLIAAVWMGAREMWEHRRHLVRGAGAVRGVWRSFGPRVGPLFALAGGFILLLSATTPMEPARRAWLEHWSPLFLVETSHFLSSLVGVALVIVARGLQRRVQAAWWAAILLSFLGVMVSLLKGIDYEEAAILSLLLLSLLPYREQFHRHSALWSGRFTLEWWLLLLGLTGVAVWLGFLTSRHVEYQNELWWQFTFAGDASRFLRAQVGVAVFLTAFIVAQALRRTPPRAAGPSPDLDKAAWENITRLVAASPSSQAHLALLGDKLFHFSASGGAFLMYGERGRSRIVMGDPVGKEEEWDELLWSFNLRAEDEGIRVCYYEISATSMSLYVDMGMRLFKLGEEAFVPLEKFSLEGPAASRLRQARSRAQRDDLQFEIWTPSQVEVGMAMLRDLSDQWLGEHHASEKSFSLGRFDETYLALNPVAVVTQAGVPCAFANLWCCDGREELSIDLMRHGRTAPGGVMDFLFVELFLWGKAQGYQQFSLGMAPLSGMAAHPLAPLWQKLGILVYERGGAFYNFQGLRDFKDKFHPEWEPRYLAVTSSWHLPAALADITALVAGGWRKIITRPKSS